MRARSLNIATLAGVLMLAHVAAATAQDKPSPPREQTPTPLKVQVVIARFQGEKKIASAPYTLAVTAPRRSRARTAANWNGGADRNPAVRAVG